MCHIYYVKFVGGGGGCSKISVYCILLNCFNGFCPPCGTLLCQVYMYLILFIESRLMILMRSVDVLTVHLNIVDLICGLVYGY